MIGFGELRKKSAAWHVELDAVEKIYALDWLLKAIVDREPLRDALTMRGASALAHAYFENYPRVEEAEFLRAASLADDALRHEVETALAEAARASGLQFRLHIFQATQARVEFAGPLGRRSAAQPLIFLRFASAAPLAAPSLRPLIHLFSDVYAADARVVALEELVAERMLSFSLKPRARDVFDLWFMLKFGAAVLDADGAIVLARRIAEEKRVVLRTALDAAYAPLLERAWENALKAIHPHPPFAQARADIETWLVSKL